MPPIREVPDTLRPYRFHGVDLSWEDKGREATAECPFCGREGKFNVEIATGLFNCFTCGEGSGGNASIFLKKLWEQSYERPCDYSELAANRGLLDSSTLAAWGICRSLLTNEWLVPGFTKDATIKNLYKWAYSVREQANVLYATPTITHGLHGVGLYDRNKRTVYVCEGWGDGVVWWESLSQLKWADKRLVQTASAGKSLLADANVVAIPGCGSVGTPFEYWLELFAGKDVVLLFDNDHPRKHPKTGDEVEPAALAAVRRAARLLSESEHPPSSIQWLQWGDMGYDLSLKSGYDLRDALQGDLSERAGIVQQLLSLVQPLPTEWITVKTTAPANVGVGCIPCTRWTDLINVWRSAMKWTPELDVTLSVMLASVASTKTLEDQLWIKVLGPPSCGKSTLCEAISTATQYVIAKSTLRGFHSGATDETGDDYSLIAKVKDKTLIIKDGDTLLQTPNLGQILSEARDLYDTTSRSSYRHKQGGRDYQGIRMSFILCGTSSLRKLDKSELGQRYLDCVMMEQVEDELEDEIIWRVVNRTERNMAFESDGDARSMQNPEMTLAMQMTGGYVCYLRENAGNLISAVDMPDDAKHFVGRLAKFVSFMRARPSDLQDEDIMKEAAFRLAAQLTKLSKCLAIVLNATVINHRVMERVRKVAMDTSRGRVLKACKLLYEANEGMITDEMVHKLNSENYAVRKLMRFLRAIQAVNLLEPPVVEGVRQKNRWHLTPRLRRLWEEVHREFGDES